MLILQTAIELVIWSIWSYDPSQKLTNFITLLLILNHFTAQNYTTHTIQNSFTNLQVTSVQQTFLHFWSSHHTTNSIYLLICSCHSLQRPSNPSRLKIFDILLVSSSCSLECSTTLSSLIFTFFSRSFSSLTIFFVSLFCFTFKQLITQLFLHSYSP